MHGWFFCNLSSTDESATCGCCLDSSLCYASITSSDAAFMLCLVPPLRVNIHLAVSFCCQHDQCVLRVRSLRLRFVEDVGCAAVVALKTLRELTLY
jgi:hypothetical protein